MGAPHFLFWYLKSFRAVHCCSLAQQYMTIITYLGQIKTVWYWAGSCSIHHSLQSHFHSVFLILFTFLPQVTRSNIYGRFDGLHNNGIGIPVLVHLDIYFVLCTRFLCWAIELCTSLLWDSYVKGWNIICICLFLLVFVRFMLSFSDQFNERELLV